MKNMMVGKESTCLALFYVLFSLADTCSGAVQTTQSLLSKTLNLRGSDISDSNASLKESIHGNYVNLENQKNAPTTILSSATSNLVRQLWFGQSKNDDDSKDGDSRDESESSYGHNSNSQSHTYGGSEDGYNSSKEKSSTSGYGGYSSNKKNDYPSSSHNTGTSTGSSSHNGYSGSSSSYGGSTGSSSYGSSSYGSSGSSSSSYKSKKDDDKKDSSWSWPWSKKDSSSSSGSGSSYNHHYGEKKKYEPPKVSLPSVLIFILIVVPIGMLLTAHQFEENPEGEYANFCRLSLTTFECIWRVMYNLYHCRLGDIPSVVCADEDDEDYTDKDLERMKLRPGIERALDVEHRKALRKTTQELSKNNSNNRQKKRPFNIQAGPGVTAEKNRPPPKQTAGTVAANVVGHVAKGALNSITSNKNINNNR